MYSIGNYINLHITYYQMIDKKLIFPGEEVPDLAVETFKSSIWSLKSSKIVNFCLIVVYRGLHCPICSNYLQEFQNNIENFDLLGTNIIAISTDNLERAKKSVENWNLNKLHIGYGLSQKTAVSWGLYLSKGIFNPSASVKEPEMFVEPGIFLVDANFKLYFSNIQSMPFTRPPVNELLSGIKFALDKDYPARGTLK